MENGCIQLTQGGPEIKYLLQEGMSRKGSLLAKLSGLLRYLISMKNSVLGLSDHHRSFLFYVRSMAHVPSQESGRELGVT